MAPKNGKKGEYVLCEAAMVLFATLSSEVVDDDISAASITICVLLWVSEYRKSLCTILESEAIVDGTADDSADCELWTSEPALPTLLELLLHVLSVVVDADGGGMVDAISGEAGFFKKGNKYKNNMD